METSGSVQDLGTAAGGYLGSLSDPQVASLPAADLVVRLYDERRPSLFADVALVLAARERRLHEAEAQIRRAGEKEARLLAEIRSLERRAVEAEALLLRRGVREPGRTVAGADNLEGPGAGDSSEIQPVVAPQDCTPDAVENEIAGILATLAVVGDDAPRLSPPRRSGGAALPVPVPAPTLQPEQLDERAEERVVDVAVLNTQEEEAPTELGCGGDAPAMDAADAEAVRRIMQLSNAAPKDSDDDDQAEQEQPFTEDQLWEMLRKTKAQVSAWEAELDTTDGGMPQATRNVLEGNIDNEVEAQGRSEATEVIRLREEISVCEGRILKANALIRAASETEEHLRAEIMERKERATETEVRLWAEIQARGYAVTELEAWKHCATEAQAQIRAASMVEARLRDEISAWKHTATKAEASYQAEIKACERRAADVTHLQEEISKRDQLAKEFKADVEAKISAQERYYTSVEAGLLAALEAKDFMIKYFEQEVQTLTTKFRDMQRHGDGQSVSGHEH